MQIHSTYLVFFNADVPMLGWKILVLKAILGGAIGYSDGKTIYIANLPPL